VDGGERREPLWIDSAGLLSLLAWSQGRARPRLAQGLCRGYLHADAYAGFAGLYEADPLTGAPAPLTEIACWAHARRRIYDIHVETKSPAAAQALEMIARLFAIEADMKGKPPAERLAARRAKATPILSELRAFLDATIEKVSGKSSLAGAFRYAASRWTALTRYVDNGRLEMTNNAAERAMRPLALGRKNYLFAGSDEGGRRAAVTLSSRPRALMTSIRKPGSAT
jgi:transposase